MTTSIRRKCRQYFVDYLRYGFIPSPHNCQLPMCLLCDRDFSNEAMKPSRLKEHFSTKHSDHADKDIAFFEYLNIIPLSKSLFLKCSRMAMIRIRMDSWHHIFPNKLQNVGNHNI